MVKEKLTQLGARIVGEKPADLDLAIRLVERILPMTDVYRDVLKAFGGPIVFDKGAKFASAERSPLNDREGLQSLEILYGIGSGNDSIEHKAAQYAGELPTSFVPIGESSGGNLVCINGNGTIYLWDHESLRNEGMWRVAASVEEFLRRLQSDDSGIGSTEGIVESESFLDL